MHSWRRCPEGDIRPEAILSRTFGSSGTALHRSVTLYKGPESWDLDFWLNSTPFWCKNHFCSLKIEGVTKYFLATNIFPKTPCSVKALPHSALHCSALVPESFLFWSSVDACRLNVWLSVVKWAYTAVLSGLGSDFFLEAILGMFSLQSVVRLFCFSALGGLLSSLFDPSSAVSLFCWWSVVYTSLWAGLPMVLLVLI